MHWCRFGPVGGDQKTSFDDQSLSSTRRADDGENNYAAARPKDSVLASPYYLKKVKTTTTIMTTTTTTTTTITTTTTTTTTTKTTTTTGTKIRSTTMRSKSSDFQGTKLHRARPTVNKLPYRITPQWPKDIANGEHQDFYEEEDDYYDDDEFNEKEGKIHDRLKVTNIDEALKYFSRERLPYRTPPQENSLGPAVPLYSLKRRKEDRPHRVRVGSDVGERHSFDPGVPQNLPNLAVPVSIA